MKKIHLFVLLVTFCSLSCTSRSIEYKKIELLIKTFKSESPEQIANYIEYPLERKYPLPAITNKHELIAHFDEIFDKRFIQMVGKSNSFHDWVEVGWRGIMFNHGDLWLSENYKIRTVNHESIMGKTTWQVAVDNQKKTLPEMYQDFDYPIYEWNSTKNHYRLDKVKDKYRLIIWDREQKVLQNVYDNGIWVAEGNIGNFYIDWTVNTEIIRVQNYSRNGEYCYNYMVFDQKELLSNERAEEKYIDIEQK